VLLWIELSKNLPGGIRVIRNKAENDLGEQVLLALKCFRLRGWKNIPYYITILSGPQNKAVIFLLPVD
jgi:hypothetical protein